MQLTSMATSIFALAGGLLSYVGSPTFGWPMRLKDSETTYIVGLLGILLSVLILLMIQEVWGHVERNW